MTGGCCVFKLVCVILVRNVDKEHLLRFFFKVKTPFSNFSGVDGTLISDRENKKNWVIQFYNESKPQQGKNAKFQNHNYTLQKC